jgi:hypothetical protein
LSQCLNIIIRADTFTFTFNDGTFNSDSVEVKDCRGLNCIRLMLGVCKRNLL